MYDATTSNRYTESVTWTTVCMRYVSEYKQTKPNHIRTYINTHIYVQKRIQIEAVTTNFQE